MVGLYKMNPVDPYSLKATGFNPESAWFQPLNLRCDILVSKFALFKFNSHRYDTAPAPRYLVGLCTLNQVDP
jgi:hypothetical protein